MWIGLSSTFMPNEHSSLSQQRFCSRLRLQFPSPQAISVSKRQLQPCDSQPLTLHFSLQIILRVVSRTLGSYCSSEPLDKRLRWGRNCAPDADKYELFISSSLIQSQIHSGCTCVLPVTWEPGYGHRADDLGLQARVLVRYCSSRTSSGLAGNGSVKFVVVKGSL